MAQMAEKICLDTDFCIAIMNGEERVQDFRNKLQDAELFISSMTVFELFLRKEKLGIVNNFMSNLVVLPFDEKCARISSSIAKELKMKGSIIDYRDIFIASAAIANNYILATFNKKHFSKINSLELFGV